MYTKLAQLANTQTQYTLTISRWAVWDTVPQTSGPPARPQTNFPDLVHTLPNLHSKWLYWRCWPDLQRFTCAKTTISQSGLNTSTHSNLIGHSPLCPPTVTPLYRSDHTHRSLLILTYYTQCHEIQHYHPARQHWKRHGTEVSDRMSSHSEPVKQRRYADRPYNTATRVDRSPNMRCRTSVPRKIRELHLTLIHKNDQLIHWNKFK